MRSFPIKFVFKLSLRSFWRIWIGVIWFHASLRVVKWDGSSDTYSTILIDFDTSALVPSLVMLEWTRFKSGENSPNDPGCKIYHDCWEQPRGFVKQNSWSRFIRLWNTITWTKLWLEMVLLLNGNISNKYTSIIDDWTFYYDWNNPIVVQKKCHSAEDSQELSVG